MIIYDQIRVGDKFYGTAKLFCDRCHGDPVIISNNECRLKLESETNAKLDELFETLYDWPHVEHVCRGGCTRSRTAVVVSMWSSSPIGVIPQVGAILPPAGEIGPQIPQSGVPDGEPSTPTLGKVLLVDGNNIVKRSHYARSERDGGVCGFVDSVSRVARRYRDRRVVVVWDGGSSPKRLAMLPTYRERHHDDETERFIDQQIERSKIVCRHLGIATLCYPHVEADDVIAYLSRQSSSSVVYSSDGDFLQLVREGHTVHRAMPGREKGIDRIVSTKTFAAETGLRSSVAFALLKAMAGDPSDKIKGVPRIGKKIATEIVTNCPGLDGWGPVTEEALASLRAWGNARLVSHWGLFLASYQLITLWSDDYLSEEVRAQIAKDLDDVSEAPTVAHDALLQLGLDEDSATRIVDSF
jgi:5'-3' exonuclease